MGDDYMDQDTIQAELGELGADKLSKFSSLPDLPEDIFLLIIDKLEAWDFVRCYRVSRSWHMLFSRPEYLRLMLKKYPFAREVQAIYASEATDRKSVDHDINWKVIFDRIAARYYHLSHGKARSITKHKLAVPEHVRLAHWHPISPWDYHESQPGGRLYFHSSLNPWQNHESRPGEKMYLFRPSFWTYEDGLLVFVPVRQREFKWDARTNMTVPVKHALVMVDLETDVTYSVDFDITKRVIRNFRLKERRLIIEWAELDAFHALNDLEKVHRHFATCFVVSPLYSPLLPHRQWLIKHHSELKLHFLGLPINSRDRFHSSHTANHYAIYVWQPNRSMYTGDEELPIESLAVWDITQPSKYLPSADPTGRLRPDPALLEGPRVVAKFSFRDLEYLGIRQHSAISLMSLAIDSGSTALVVRENVCVAGQGYFDPAERLWSARTTIFPFIGQGPHLRRELDGNLPPYRGNCSMETVDVLEAEKWFLGIMDVVDSEARVRFSLVETVFTGQLIENKKLLRTDVMGWHGVLLDDHLTREVSHMGRIAGDERWLIGQNGSQELVVLKF